MFESQDILIFINIQNFKNILVPVIIFTILLLKEGRKEMEEPFRVL